MKRLPALAAVLLLASCSSGPDNSGKPAEPVACRWRLAKGDQFAFTLEAFVETVIDGQGSEAQGRYDMTFEGTIRIETVAEDGRADGRMTFSKFEGKCRTSKATFPIHSEPDWLRKAVIPCAFKPRGSFGWVRPIYGNLDLDKCLVDLFVDFPADTVAEGTAWKGERQGLTMEYRVKGTPDASQKVIVEGAPFPDPKVDAGGSVRIVFDPKAGCVTRIEEDLKFTTVRKAGGDEVTTKKTLQRTLTLERR